MEHDHRNGPSHEGLSHEGSGIDWQSLMACASKWGQGDRGAGWPFGCGKSTLMLILGLIDTPTGGSYKLLGEEMPQRLRRERTQLRKANLGFVFQSFNLIDELTVFENVEFAFERSKVPAAERKEARRSRALEDEHEPPHEALPLAALAASSNAWRWRERWCPHRNSFTRGRAHGNLELGAR